MVYMVIAFALLVADDDITNNFNEVLCNSESDQ